MAGRDIKISLKLNDQLTAALKNVTKQAKSSIGGIQDKLNSLKTPKLGATSGTGGISRGDLIGANILSDAISGVASGVVSAGQQLIGAIGNMFNEASQAQSGALGSASAISALLGKDLETGLAIQDQVTGLLAESAKKLPGSTKDYLDSFNGLSDSLVLSGGLTAKGLTKAGQDMTELNALLSKSTGTSAQYTATMLGKLVGEGGSEHLFNNNAFENLPAFKALLEKELKGAGKTLGDFFKMESKQRQDYLVATKQKLFSPEILKKMNQTAQGQIDTMMSDLFDPNAGLFGFLRKVKVGGINTTVLDEIPKLFQQLGSLGSTIGNLLSSLGIDFGDPMVAMINAMRSVGSMVDRITGFFSAILIQSNMNSLNPGQIMSEIGSRLLGVIQSTISGVQSFVSAGMQSLISMLSGADFNQIGFTVMDSLLRGVSYLMNAQRDFLIANQGTILGLVYQGAVALMNLIGGAVRGIAVNIIPVTISIITGAFTLLMTAVGSAISGLVGASVGLVQSGLRNAMTILGSIGEAISDGLRTLWNSITSMFSGAANRNLGASGKGSVGNSYAGNLLSALRTESQMMPTNATPMIANSSEIIIPKERMGDMKNLINISVTAKVDQIVSEVSNALGSSLRNSPLSMVS